MTKNVLAIAIISVVCIAFCGCQEFDSNDPVFKADLAEKDFALKQGYEMPDTREVDLVETLAASRYQYLKDLYQLRSYYDETGSQKKYRWSTKEAIALEKAPKYKYLMAAESAGTNLQAVDSFESADQLYENAMKLYRQGMVIPVVPDKSFMRKSLAKFNKLIVDYPSSDKIDDAAYRSGEMYEHFKDYSIAVNYYQRAYQWDNSTPYPARYKAARILDKKLKKRDEALVLYQLAVEDESNFKFYSEEARRRIIKLNVGKNRDEDVQEVGEARKEQIKIEKQETKERAKEAKAQEELTK